MLREPDDLDARGAMLLGSHLAGLAIEHSMLGAAHACANPLTAQFDVAHGIAVSLMLPHVVRWNAEVAGPLYADLLDGPGTPDPLAGERLATELEQVAATCGFPLSLAEAGVREDALPALAEAAAAQWTGGFNPRPVTRESALALYRAAWQPLIASGRTMLCGGDGVPRARTAAPAPGCETRSSSCSRRSGDRCGNDVVTGTR